MYGLLIVGVRIHPSCLNLVLVLICTKPLECLYTLRWNIFYLKYFDVLLIFLLEVSPGSNRIQASKVLRKAGNKMILIIHNSFSFMTVTYNCFSHIFLNFEHQKTNMLSFHYIDSACISKFIDHIDIFLSIHVLRIVFLYCSD